MRRDFVCKRERRNNGKATKMKADDMNTSDVNRTTNFNFEGRSRTATRAARSIRVVIAIVLASAGMLFLMLVAGVMGSSHSAPSLPAQPGSRTFVTAYGNVTQQVEYGLTPESVVATADGGYLAVSLTDPPSEFLKDWLLMTSIFASFKA